MNMISAVGKQALVAAWKSLFYSGLDVCYIGYVTLVSDNSTCLSTSCLFIHFRV